MDEYPDCLVVRVNADGTSEAITTPMHLAEALEFLQGFLSRNLSVFVGISRVSQEEAKRLYEDHDWFTPSDTAIVWEPS